MIVKPFGFFKTGAAPFDFVFTEKLTNIGSDGSEGPAFSSARNDDMTYNPVSDTYFVIADGGSTDTYHYDYEYPAKTGAYVGKANPGFSNRGIVWNGTEYIESYFQNLSGTKENPTLAAKYDQNTAGTGSFDINGSPINILGGSGEFRGLAYDDVNNVYAMLDQSAGRIKFRTGLTQTDPYGDLVTVQNRPTGVAFSKTYNKMFVTFRDLNIDGDGLIEMYDYDFDNPAQPDNRTDLIMSASDIGSAGGNVFRIGGCAIDDSRNNLIVLHNNAGSGTTVNKSEGFVYSLDG